MFLDNIFLQNHIYNRDIVYSNTYKNGNNRINKDESNFNILMGIEIKNMSFDSIKIKKDNILLSKIYPHHFIKLENECYISHFFNQPLPLVSIIYDNLFIESNIDYRLLFVNVEIQAIKTLIKESITIDALDFSKLRLERGQIFNEPNSMFILSNYKYVQQLLCLIKNNKKKIIKDNNVDASYVLDFHDTTWG